jgi:hypothetical protein
VITSSCWLSICATFYLAFARLLQLFAGERANRVGTELPRDPVSRGNAPIPQVRSPGRVRLPAGRVWRSNSALSPPATICVLHLQNMVREHADTDGLAPDEDLNLQPEGCCQEVSVAFTTDPVKSGLGESAITVRFPVEVTVVYATQLS